MIELKTAALMAAGVEAAAILAATTRRWSSRFRRFGDRLGLAFQMADDVKGAFWARVRRREGGGRRPAAAEEDDAGHLGPEPRRRRRRRRLRTSRLRGPPMTAAS